MQIEVKQAGYTYQPDTPFVHEALQELTVTFASGKVHALAGATGSGKSTLLQLFNALEKPTTGTVTVGRHTVRPDSKSRDLHTLRAETGMVFQFPEHQLFEETVLQDVMFGPLNHGVPKAEAKARALEALARTGLSADLHHRTPFALSGGQMRRAAAAGVLALEPKLLLLDEPTAGLDPRGREEMMQLFTDWCREKPERTLVFVTHHMEHIAAYADVATILHEGRLHMQGPPAEVFQSQQQLQEASLTPPETLQIVHRLQQEGIHLDGPVLTETELATALQRYWRHAR
ncbi:energy-coupling factor transporter ATPase [Alkalicoccus chagannorensis]|uniref:energy-coupling factor transporter ATPase n=1 Tax=Alkalicoccus chagannorensis TaxID=427072 RepID=UPI00041695DC|nr:energy-coupling factor transporter ATPase [Alkalicoccus chagannorensis]